MKVVTAREMKEIDVKTIQEFGISGAILMEQAGTAVVRKVNELFGRKRTIVVSGSGNNGGDGLVIARHLHNNGWDVSVFLMSEPGSLSADALTQYRAAERFGVAVHPVEKLLTQHQSFLSPHALVIDAIFGTGMSRPVRGVHSDVITLINTSGLPVVSVDIPSGISSDNGQVLGNAVKADYTVTFGLPKRGHLLHPGATFSGKLSVEDIGFPQTLITSDDLGVELLDESFTSRLIPLREVYSHKGRYGHILIIAGSRGKTGAARMAAKACLRSGAGLVTVGVPDSLAEAFQSCFSEEMTLVLPDRGNGFLSSRASQMILDFIHHMADVVAVGPGIGVSTHTAKIVRDIVQDASCPVVIDADGIHALGGNRKMIGKAKTPLILTPHPREMQSLLKGSDVLDIEKDRIGTAISFARDTHTHLVLKGVPTVIASPEAKAFVNSTGNPGMATAGTGDVLTGLIAGLLGQTGNALHASIVGVYLHGLAGDLAASKRGQHSLIATDLIDEIPAAYRALRSER